MKKLIVLGLCFAMLFLAACSNTPDDEVSSQPDALSEIEVAAAKGELEGLKFPLRADADEVKDYFKQLEKDYLKEHGDDEQDHNHFMEDEGYAYYELLDMPKYMLIDTAEARYYYSGRNKSKGILAIATDNEIFGFTPGITSKYEVEAEFTTPGETVTADEGDLEMLSMAQDNLIILRYTFDDYQLDFYFSENKLITTALVDAENWVY